MYARKSDTTNIEKHRTWSRKVTQNHEQSIKRDDANRAINSNKKGLRGELPGVALSPISSQRKLSTAEKQPRKRLTSESEPSKKQNICSRGEKPGGALSPISFQRKLSAAEK